MCFPNKVGAVPASFQMCIAVQHGSRIGQAGIKLQTTLKDSQPNRPDPLNQNRPDTNNPRLETVVSVPQSANVAFGKVPPFDMQIERCYLTTKAHSHAEQAVLPKLKTALTASVWPATPVRHSPFDAI